MRVTKGFSLVELMVALTLSLVLMAGVIELFVANKRSYQTSDAIAYMQESARFAAYLLEKDIRMAGFTGCTGRDQDNVKVVNHLASVPGTFSPERGVEGWESDPGVKDTRYGNYVSVLNAGVSDASGSGWVTSTSEIPVMNNGTQSVANSDVIRVWSVDGGEVLATVGGTNVAASVSTPYQAGDLLMLSDCRSVDIAAVCSLTGNTATLNCSSNNITSGLLNNGKSGVSASRLSGWLYYVGKRNNSSTNPPALFRRQIDSVAGAPAVPLAGNAEELVQGVESMQLLYGEDTSTDPDGVADRYVNANDVSDWDDVISVRIQLLMQSQRTDLVEGGQTIAFNGDMLTMNDGRLRYPFMTTVSLRNRTP